MHKNTLAIFALQQPYFQFFWQQGDTNPQLPLVVPDAAKNHTPLQDGD